MKKYYKVVDKNKDSIITLADYINYSGKYKIYPKFGSIFVFDNLKNALQFIERYTRDIHGYIYECVGKKSKYQGDRIALFPFDKIAFWFNMKNIPTSKVVIGTIFMDWIKMGKQIKHF